MESKQKYHYAGIFLVFGTAIGGGMGLIISQNVAVGAGIGAGLGLIFGAIVDNHLSPPAR
jgi:hypothetical protein